MNFSEINEEHKVQINLSAATWQIIENDISLFYCNDVPNLSGPLNRIFQNYFEVSSLNLSQKLPQKETQLRKLLSIGNLSKESEDIICSQYIKNELDALSKKYTSVPKGIGKKIRISDMNYNTLASFSDFSYECMLFAPSTGKFLSAIFEEYATLSQYEREAIAFIDEMETLQYAIDTHTMILLSLDSDNTNEKVYQIKPYIIMADSTKRFNYLAGFSRLANTDDEFKIASFRISKAKKIKRTKDKFSLSKESISIIKKGIQEKGIPFLVGELETYEVTFSPEGLNRFRSILNLRPNIVSYNKNKFVLRSTIYQKEKYFQQFSSEEYTF